MLLSARNLSVFHSVPVSLSFYLSVTMTNVPLSPSLPLPLILPMTDDDPPPSALSNHGGRGTDERASGGDA